MFIGEETVSDDGMRLKILFVSSFIFNSTVSHVHLSNELGSICGSQSFTGYDMLSLFNSTVKLNTHIPTKSKTL